MAYSKKSSHAESKVAEPDITGSYTVGDYLRWEIEEMVELIRGKVFKMIPSPGISHQRVSSRLLELIFRSERPPNCEVFHEPTDVYLFAKSEFTEEEIKNQTTVVQPDIFMVCTPGKINPLGCLGPPDLAMEILSPGTRTKDLTTKKNLYHDAGVPELWYLSTEERLIIRNVWAAEGYIEKTFTEDQKISSAKFPMLHFELKDLFATLDRN